MTSVSFFRGVGWAEAQRLVSLGMGTILMIHQMAFADEIQVEVVSIAAGLIGVPMIAFRYPDDEDKR